MRGPGRALTLGLLAALAGVLPAALPARPHAAPRVQSLPGADRANVAIRRTAHGIPHIVGSNFRNLAYGYGYAFAQDNICTIASSYVTVRAERSRFFGPEEQLEVRGQRLDREQPQLGLLLQAHHRHRSGGEAEGAEAAERSASRDRAAV